MELGETNQETYATLNYEGWEYDSANKTYYSISRQGVKKLQGKSIGDKVSQPSSNYMQKFED